MTPTAADIAVQHAVAATAAATGAAAWWATATEVASAVFGVPLQVVLAAATGAFAARSFQTGTTYLKALGAGISWTIIGIFCCQIAVWILTKYLGEAPPAGASAGAALIVSAGGQLFLTKEIVEKIRRAVGRFVDGIGRGS